MEKLIAFLLEHIVVDFTGELNLDIARDLLREDGSPLARSVLAKMVSDGRVDDMMVTLADCLQDYIRSGINEDVVREQLSLYSES